MAHRQRNTRGRNARHKRGPDTEAIGQPTEIDEPVRLNRYIAKSGVCSRRKADDLIDQKRVKVNGEVVTEYWYQVQPDDEVEVNGTIISPRAHVYILLNKPKGVITTTDDERGRDTVLDLIELPGVEQAGLFPVGRLDRDTVGTLLLTNDGELAHRLMHPSYEVDKLYIVRAKKPIQPDELARLAEGVTLEDGPAKADHVAYTQPPDQHEIGMQLHEGRNRQIRRMIEAIGNEVETLERVNYASLTTEGVRRGKWRRLQPHEVKRLRNLVHLK